MMRRFLTWLIGPSTIEPTPEQLELLRHADAYERKLKRAADRRRMLDLEADVVTRQEPSDVS